MVLCQLGSCVHKVPELLLLRLPVLLTQYCWVNKIEKNEMGRTCSAYGGEERRIQGFGGEN